MKKDGKRKKNEQPDDAGTRHGKQANMVTGQIGAVSCSGNLAADNLINSAPVVDSIICR